VTPRRYFVKTCARDLEWLGYLLRSLALFDPEAPVRVICDGTEATVMSSWTTGTLRSSPLHTFETSAHLWPEALQIANPYIRQQYVKLTADRAYPEGLHIQIDSDCFMLRPPAPGDFERNGRPVWFREPYDRLPGVPWRAPTEAALGWPVADEFMRRCALPVSAAVLRAVREHIEIRAGMPLVDYLAAVRTFSEYNVIGAWIASDDEHCGYAMPQTPGAPSWGLPSPCVEQGWSARPMDAARRERYEQILAG
jgi:hypothetical protein